MMDNDKKLCTVAYNMVSTCKDTHHLSPADTVIALATAIGIAVAKSANDWPDESTEVIGRLAKITFDAMRDPANPSPV